MGLALGNNLLLLLRLKALLLDLCLKALQIRVSFVNHLHKLLELSSLLLNQLTTLEHLLL